MSFFEKMMRINEQKNHSQPFSQQSRRLNFEEELTGEVEPQFGKSSNTKEKTNMQDTQKQSVISNNLDEEPLWEDICDEPKIELVYRQPKPKLMVYLLPKREQLLHNMMVKKRQFQIKTLEQSINNNDHKQQHKNSSSAKYKHQQSRISVVNSQCNANIGGKLIESKVSLLQSLKSPTNRVFSSMKPKESSQKKQSRYSSRANQEAKKVKQSENDNLNKQIVMRLLNLLENDRHDRSHLLGLSTNAQSNGCKHPREKDAPIIINNIMKTPMESLNRDLIERQMKIKILENNRYMRNELSQTRKSNTSQTIKQRFLVSELLEEEKERLSQVAAKTVYINSDTGRTQLDKQNIERITEQSIERKQSTNSNNKASVQNSRITTKTEFDLPVKKVSLKINTPADQLQNSRNKFDHARSTNYNSQQNSQIRKQSKVNHQKVRQFDLERRAKNGKNNEQQPDESGLKLQDNDTTPVYIKPPVFLQIAVDNSMANQGITLAEAFKRKIGRLKSEKQKEDKENESPLKTNRLLAKKMTAPMTTAYHQISITLTDQLTDNKIKKERFKQDNPSVQNRQLNRKNQHLQSDKKEGSLAKAARNRQRKKEQQKKSVENQSREPSKELIDRLIYGQRAKVSKVEMYALTKKNYENLPEVKAKKKEEQNKKLELQRLAKVKQYQRHIRSGKSLKKQ